MKRDIALSLSLETHSAEQRSRSGNTLLDVGLSTGLDYISINCAQFTQEQMN